MTKMTAEAGKSEADEDEAMAVFWLVFKRLTRKESSLL
jgi:hypothetical protein